MTASARSSVLTLGGCSLIEPFAETRRSRSRRERLGPCVSICRQLDGLPLALELAAARLDTLDVEEIARELGGQGRLATAGSAGEPSRHSSLRASLDWSYRLLDETERALIRRLSVFSGGFTAEAAHGVAAPAESVTDVHDLLRALERKGLLVPAPTGAPERWRLLSTVAEYAGEELSEGR